MFPNTHLQVKEAIPRKLSAGDSFEPLQPNVTRATSRPYRRREPDACTRFRALAHLDNRCYSQLPYSPVCREIFGVNCPMNNAPIYDYNGSSKSLTEYYPQPVLTPDRSRGSSPCSSDEADQLFQYLEGEGLNFAYQTLRTIPPALFSYTEITSLDLRYTRLTHLPSEIGKLRKLRYLNLSGNRLESLPAELGMLVNLRTLNLNGTRITRLPHQLGSLRRLEYLWLENVPLAPEQRALYAKDDVQALITHLQQTAPELEAPQARKTIDLDRFANMDANDGISVLTYNTLSPACAVPARHTSILPDMLAWGKRRKNILRDIKKQSSDVVCLQEIDTQSFHSYWTPTLRTLGYAGIFGPKTRKPLSKKEEGELDGCATFYREAKFLLLHSQVISLASVAINRRDLHDPCGNVFSRVGTKDNIAIVAFLQNRFTGARQLVANTHLAANPAYNDVKIVQAAVLVHQLTEMAVSYARWAPCDSSIVNCIAGDASVVAAEEFSPIAPLQRYLSGADIPLFISGDFNSLPGSGVHELLSTGHLEPDHPDFLGYSYGQFTTFGIRHQLRLGSAYAPVGEMPFTTYTPHLKGTIDYIWHTVHSSKVVSLLGPVDDAYAATVPGFPSEHFPSDHVHLAAKFAVKRSACGVGFCSGLNMVQEADVERSLCSQVETAAARRRRLAEGMMMTMRNLQFKMERA